MKQIVWISMVVIFSAYYNVSAQNKAEGIPQDTTLKTPKIIFANSQHDFGEIRKGEKVLTSFYFKNTGTRPLVILQVQTSCGCTATHWSKEPIAPNATSEIAVTFDSAAGDKLIGQQNKSLLVISNAVNKEVELYLKGNVVKPKTE
jgi:hypothetical protein